MPGQWHSQPTDFVWSKVHACLGVTCHLNFWQADWGLLTCHCGSTGAEQTPKKSQRTKLALEKKILLPLPPGFKLATF